jgi:hypothetical protein
MKEFVETLTSLFCGVTNQVPAHTANGGSNSDNTGNIRELSYSKERSGIFKKSTNLSLLQQQVDHAQATLVFKM